MQEAPSAGPHTGALRFSRRTDIFFAGMFASAVVLSCVMAIGAQAASQPGYSGGQQYYALQPQQYLQQVQPQYISAPPIPQGPATSVFDPAPQKQVVQQYVASPPTQRVSQLLLPSAADRQVQKVAQQVAGPQYVQEVQLRQQQGLANEAIAAAERRALRRAQLQAQQAQQAQQQQGHATQQYVEVAPRQQYVQAQPQQYQIQYEPQYQYESEPTAKPLRAIAQPQRKQQQQQKEPEEEHDINSTYQFGFDVKDDLYTNYQNRKEQREGGKISGSYSVVDSDGFIRTVTYTADPKEGFKAEVVRKPTDIVVKIPQPQPKEQSAQQAQPQQQYQQETPQYYPQPQQPQQPRYQAQPQYQQQQQQPQYSQQQPQKVVYQYQ